jgi:antitoxin VapB
VADTAIARLFTHGRSQVVRLPKEFRLPGDRVRVHHAGDGVLLEPIASDVDAWFAELDRFADVPLFEDGRNQPPTPGRIAGHHRAELGRLDDLRRTRC